MFRLSESLQELKMPFSGRFAVFSATDKHSVLYLKILNDPPVIPTSFIYFEAWKVQEGIRIEGSLLTCEGGTMNCGPGKHFHGARYLTPFSPDFPHFEVGNKNVSYQLSVVTHHDPYFFQFRYSLTLTVVSS